jgi:glutathione S-transferase
MPWVYLVLCLAVIFYIATGWTVGRMRHKHNILPPACVGHPEFERAFRVQQNTMEQLVPFMPMDYFFAQLVSPLGAAVLGVVWIGGRLLYMQGYMNDPAKRGPGMIMTMLTTAVLTLGVLVAAVIELVHA